MARRPNTAQHAAIQALVARMEPAVRDAFLAAIYAVRGSVDIAALVEALETGNIEAAVKMLEIDQGRLWPLDEAIRGVYVAGAQHAVDGQPSTIRGGFGFNGRSPRAEAWLAEISSTLIQDIRDASNQAVREQLLRAVRPALGGAMAESRTTRAAALDITGRLNATTGRREGGILGLTTQQAGYAVNARAELTALDGSYFSRAKRDRRFDRMVRKAIEAGKPLSAKDIDKITGAYSDRLLKYRGEVIARNETFSAQAAGQYEAMLQIKDQPGIAQVTGTWQHNLSQEPRETHVAMSGTVVEIGQTFNFPDASMKYAHDPAGGARNSIGCRCTVFWRAVRERD